MSIEGNWRVNQKAARFTAHPAPIREHDTVKISTHDAGKRSGAMHRKPLLAIIVIGVLVYAGYALLRPDEIESIQIRRAAIDSMVKQEKNLSQGGEADGRGGLTHGNARCVHGTGLVLVRRQRDMRVSMSEEEWQAVFSPCSGPASFDGKGMSRWPFLWVDPMGPSDRALARGYSAGTNGA